MLFEARISFPGLGRRSSPRLQRAHMHGSGKSLTWKRAWLEKICGTCEVYIYVYKYVYHQMPSTIIYFIYCRCTRLMYDFLYVIPKISIDANPFMSSSSRILSCIFPKVLSDWSEVVFSSGGASFVKNLASQTTGFGLVEVDPGFSACDFFLLTFSFGDWASFFRGPKLAACASIRKLGESRWRTGLELSSSRVYMLLWRVCTVGWGDRRLKGTQKRSSTI